MLRRLLETIRRFRYRSSMTGRFVSREYAEKHPDVTEKERME